MLEAATALGMGMVSVIAGNCPGFIGNRMLATYVREARMMLLEGAYPHQVDAALQGSASPWARSACMTWWVSTWNGARRSWPARGQDEAECRWITVCELGRFGQKSRMGYYRYAEGSRQPSTIRKWTPWCSAVRAPRL